MDMHERGIDAAVQVLDDTPAAHPFDDRAVRAMAERVVDAYMSAWASLQTPDSIAIVQGVPDARKD